MARVRLSVGSGHVLLIRTWVGLDRTVSIATRDIDSEFLLVCPSLCLSEDEVMD